MSILAEPKRKQRISVDPQNLSWAKNEDAVGKKMLEKMGWSEGDGLGKNRHGMTANLKVKANTRGKGLGAGAGNDYDSTWISHHDDFADLLSALNKNKPTTDSKEGEEKVAKKISLELSSKSLKRRIHYQKFTRAKDVSNFDENAKKSVFGKGISNKTVEVVESVAPVKNETNSAEAEEAEKSVKQNHLVSSVSVGDYFKDKMAAKLAALKRSTVKTEIIKEELDFEETQFSGFLVKIEAENEEECVEESIIDEKKKKKKRKHQEDSQDSNEIPDKRIKIEENALQDESHEVLEKKLKSKNHAEEEEFVEENLSERKKKKKSKKTRQELAEDIQIAPIEDVEHSEQSGEKKKKKKKKEKRENEQE